VRALPLELPSRDSRAHQASLARRWLLLCVACLLLLVSMDAVAGIDQKFPEAKGYFPSATRFGDVTGKPPAAPVYDGDKVIGYVFESVMVAPVPAYSGDPVNILVAIDQTGKILGTKVLEQHEPILLVGIPVQRLYDFVARYIGHNVKDDIVVGGSSAPGSIKIDAISSATVTSMVVNETIMNAALAVAVSRNLVTGRTASASAPATTRTDYFKKSGCAFAYFLVLPAAFRFLTAMTPGGVEMMTDINHYLDFVMLVFFAFGLCFEVPVAVVILAAAGVVDLARLRRSRRYVIVGAFAISAVITPPDITSMIMLAVPMYLLYELGVLAVRWLVAPQLAETVG
jgi:hypothetical protein